MPLASKAVRLVPLVRMRVVVRLVAARCVKRVNMRMAPVRLPVPCVVLVAIRM